MNIEHPKKELFKPDTDRVKTEMNSRVYRFFFSSFSLNKMYYTPEILRLNGNIHFSKRRTQFSNTKTDAKKRQRFNSKLLKKGIQSAGKKASK